MKIKRYLKTLYVNLKNLMKNVKIHSSCTVSLKANFEGNNRVGEKSTFYGKIGRCSYIGSNCNLSASIGRYSCLGNDIKVINGLHPTNTFVSIHPVFFSTKKQVGISYVYEDKFDELKYFDNKNKTAINIGNDVWIGSCVIIMAGVKIGDGAIVGAGAVVTKDVPPYSIVVGVPAKVIKYRFSEDIIKKLLKIKWWDKTECWIKENSKLFANINDFCSALKDGDYNEDL